MMRSSCARTSPVGDLSKPSARCALLGLLVACVACSGEIGSEGASEAVGDGTTSPSSSAPIGTTSGPIPTSTIPNPAGEAPGLTPAPSSPGTNTVPANPASPSVAYQPPPATSPELPARTWRLTHEQYRLSIRELVGVDVDLSDFAPESGNGNYANFSSTAFVRVDLANNYFNVAKATARALTAQQLGALTGCGGLAACADQFIQELSARAFRRPATPGDLSRYRPVFDAGAAGGDVLEGFRAVVQGILNSPQFLYRTEFGDPAVEGSGAVSMTNHEVASLLSYSLLGGPPPASLLEAASRGELTTPEGLRTQVDQLLGTPAALDQLRSFLTEWLEVHHFSDVEKFEEVFPGFDHVKQEMEHELAQFLASNGTPRSTLADLFLGPVPSVSGELDGFYFSDPSAPAQGTRVGVLGLGTVLSHHAKSYLTSPTLRGTFVRKRFFCQEITLPEGFTPPALSETERLGVATTTRELYERHQSDPSCAACHRLTDDIGFVLEGFDGAARFRTLDTTQGDSVPIDTTGNLSDSDVNRPMASPNDLAAAMAESEIVRECMARQAFRFYFGQGETSRGQPPIVEAHTAFRSGGELGQLLVGLMSSPGTYARQR